MLLQKIHFRPEIKNTKMNDLLGKISSYNLFNYLFSGVVFVVLSEAFTSYSFIQKDVTTGIFLYYFIGLVLSRLGSLIIQPIMEIFSFVKFTKYSDFVTTAKTDPTLEVLSEANNTYRTLTAVFFALIFLKLYEILKISFIRTSEFEVYALLLFLLIMFSFAYRKQSSYITERIKANLKKHE